MAQPNILLDLLKQMVQLHPGSVFINSLYQQFCNLGGLSKKQLEGLYNLAAKTPGIAPNKLATLEAIIKKKPTRERAGATIKTTEHKKDEATGKLIEAILAKYPEHKRMLFLRSKYDQGLMNATETAEVQKFAKLLLSKPA